MPEIRYWARQYWPDLLTAATAADPKEALEMELFALLDGDPAITWTVYNTQATGATFEYVVIQASGGDDDHMKLRGHVYEYQIVGVHTNRMTSLEMSAAIEAVMATAKTTVSIADFAVIWVERINPVDYVQELPDGRLVYHVGGMYQIMLRED